MKRRLPEGYVTYQSTWIDTKGAFTRKVDASVSNHVPMNSVSAGHPLLKNLRLSVKEARLLMKKAAGLTTEK